MPSELGRGLAERLGVDAPDRAAAVAELERAIRASGVQVVRLSFVDQHGLLRGKTVVAEEAPRFLREGCGAPSSLLLKDTANRTVFSAFTAGAGVGVEEMQGAADMVMVPDPATFKVLPWSPRTGWLLCDLRLADGRAPPMSTRDLFRRIVGGLAGRGYEFVAGAELEFHLFRVRDPRLQPADAGQPGEPPEVELLNKGYQYLSEFCSDGLDDLFEHIRIGLQGLELPLATMEVEYGPSQCEVTFKPRVGVEAADLVVLARSAIKQIAARHGHHATFMCRPRIPHVISSGWHLHQSLRRTTGGTNAFVPGDADEILSDLGKSYLAGLLANAGAAAAFTTPTINGYKRYRPFSNAPDRAIWGRDNRGAMVRVIGGALRPDTRLENRVGEPAANPYLYMASQIVSGLDGVDRSLEPGPSADTPYHTTAELLPRSLEAALSDLASSQVFEKAFGKAFVDYWIGLKSAELSRFNSEVTEWEQREYFSIF